MAVDEYFGGFDFKPLVKSKEELLREEFSDLQDKWDNYLSKKEEYYYWQKQLAAFTFLERWFKSRSYIFA